MWPAIAAVVAVLVLGAGAAEAQPSSAAKAKQKKESKPAAESAPKGADSNTAKLDASVAATILAKTRWQLLALRAEGATTEQIEAVIKQSGLSAKDIEKEKVSLASKVFRLIGATTGTCPTQYGGGVTTRCIWVKTWCLERVDAHPGIRITWWDEHGLPDRTSYSSELTGRVECRPADIRDFVLLLPPQPALPFIIDAPAK